MSTEIPTFGGRVRERRMQKGYSLRSLAKRIGVSPTYLSHIEQGKVEAPPTAERVREIAIVLGENADELIALAGRVPEDLPEIIRRQPIKIPALLREIDDLTPEQLQEITEQIRRLKKRPAK